MVQDKTISCVTCNKSPVTYHISLPQHAQQDAAADLDLDPVEKSQKSFFPFGSFPNILRQNRNSVTDILSLLYLRNLFEID